MKYDQDNIFAKILKGEITCDKIYEDAYVLAFNDINPHALIHALVIPKKFYLNSYDFYTRASDAEIVGYYQGLNITIDRLKIKDFGYRLITNIGAYGGQEIFHFHTHILGGEDLTLRGSII